MIIEVEAVLKLLEHRQEEVKNRLCNPGMSYDATQLERGRYLELRHLISEFEKSREG